jgi:hypothetical protein
VEPLGQDVLHEPPKELDRMERGFVTALRVKRHSVAGNGDVLAITQERTNLSSPVDRRRTGLRVA